MTGTTCMIICGIVAAVAVVVIFLNSRKMKKVREETAAEIQKNNEETDSLRADIASQKEQIETEKNQITAEREEIAALRTELEKDQEDLRNEQLMFANTKRIHDQLEQKTEKEIAVDLFLKFKDMETLFDYLKSNLASIDAKLEGVKNYSSDLETMKKEVTEGITALRSETAEEIHSLQTGTASDITALRTNMTELQQNYSASLESIHGDLKASLANVESQISGTVSAITEREMQTMTRQMNSGLADMNNTVTSSVQGMSEQFGEQIKACMPPAIGKEDVQSAMENVLGSRTISDLNGNDVKSACTDAVRSVLKEMSPSPEHLQETIHDALESSVSDLSSGISSLQSQVNEIHSDINSLKQN